MNILEQRLINQHLHAPSLRDPAAVVGWLGAVQAQEYGSSLWALGLRLNAATEATVEAAFNAGAFLRTHVLRPTWHYVAPADIRWMLELTAPRVHAATAYYDRQLKLDDAALKPCFRIIEQALEGGRQLTRTELRAALEEGGVAVGNGQRLAHIMMHAELNGLVCSGARRGKQQTYALLDERVPPAPALSRDEALAELTRRYFTSHAPATIKDFAWWSGLTVADVKLGLELNAGRINSAEMDGGTYWFADPPSPPQTAAPPAYLLPNFDEFTVAYVDRSSIVEERHAATLTDWGGSLSNLILYERRAIGGWQRTLKKSVVSVVIQPFAPFSDEQDAAVRDAAQRYADFLGVELTLE